MEDATEEEKNIDMNMIIVALWCTQIEPSDCLSMKIVVEMLEGEIKRLKMPTKTFLTSSKRLIGNVGDNLNPTCSSIHLGESSHSTQF